MYRVDDKVKRRNLKYLLSATEAERDAAVDQYLPSWLDRNAEFPLTCAIPDCRAGVNCGNTRLRVIPPATFTGHC